MVRGYQESGLAEGSGFSRRSSANSFRYTTSNPTAVETISDVEFIS